MAGSIALTGSASPAGEVAFITGAGSGIGASLAAHAAKAGMRLALSDIDEAALAGTASRFPDSDVMTIAIDVSDADAMDDCADRVYRRFGSVGLLCNNAGVVPGGRHRPVWEYDAQDWQWAFGVNVIGIANGLKSFVPRMLAADRPAHILNTTSISGFISGAGSPVYGASKHAAVRLTEALYASLKERGSRIGVSMLCPGLVRTRIFETERVRPAHLQAEGGAAAELAELQNIADSGADPDDVARQAFEGIERGDFYILTTRNYHAAIRRRIDTILTGGVPQFDDFATASRQDVAT